MISKELLGEVLEADISGFDIRDNVVSYSYPCYITEGSFVEETINIHELAHKCKEWVSKQGYALYTGRNDDIWICATEENFLGTPTGKLIAVPEFTSDTEPEAIFKACGWILQQKEV